MSRRGVIHPSFSREKFPKWPATWHEAKIWKHIWTKLNFKNLVTPRSQKDTQIPTNPQKGKSRANIGLYKNPQGSNGEKHFLPGEEGLGSARLFEVTWHPHPRGVGAFCPYVFCVFLDKCSSTVFSMIKSVSGLCSKNWSCGKILVV